jgi:iron complex outermembrane receptor protein
MRFKARKLAVLLATAGTPICVPQAYAQDSGTAPAAEETSAPSGTEIIVTAQRRGERLERTPVAVSALSAESLETQGIESERDLQSAVPGLLVRAGQDSNQINYAIRGQTVDTYSFSAPAVQPYENEVPASSFVPTAFYDLESVQVLKGPQGTLFGQNVTGGAVLFTTVRPSDEFEGYASVAAGNYDLWEAEGAINAPLVTDVLAVRVAGKIERRDGYQKNLYTGDRVGDVRRESARLSIRLSPGDVFQNDFILGYARSRGSGLAGVLYSVYSPGQTNNGFPLNGGTTALFSPFLDVAFQAPGAWQAYLAAHPKAFPGGLGALLDVQRARGPYIVDVDAQPRASGRTISVTNISTLELSDTISLKNVFGYSDSYLNTSTDLDASPYGIYIPAGFPQNAYDLSQVTEELQLVGTRVGGHLDFVAGVYYNKTKSSYFTDNFFFDLAPILAPQGSKTGNYYNNRTLAGYAQGTLQLGDLIGADGLGITAGLRYTDRKTTNELDPVANFNALPGIEPFQEVTDRRWSYQFGIQYQANPQLLLYGVTRRSFRGSGFNLFSPPLPGFADTGGSRFRPEVATDVEFGIKYAGNAGTMPVRFNIAAYKLWIDNVQRITFVTIPQLNNYVGEVTANVPEAQVKGIEIDGQIQPADWLSLGGALTYTDAKFTENATTLFNVPKQFGPYPDAPKWSGSMFAALTIPMGSGDVGLRADYFGQTSQYFSSLADTTLPGTKIPGYSLVNMRLSFDDIVAPGLSISASVRNIFKKTYYVGGLPLGEGLSVNTVIPGEPRTWRVELKYKW